MTDEQNTSTIMDHNGSVQGNQGQCVVYKFRSRPPYEGFVLILIIVVICILLIWWLNSKLSVGS
jgi:hypothetical protein